MRILVISWQNVFTGSFLLGGFFHVGIGCLYIIITMIALCQILILCLITAKKY